MGHIWYISKSSKKKKEKEEDIFKLSSVVAIIMKVGRNHTWHFCIVWPAMKGDKRRKQNQILHENKRRHHLLPF